MQFSFFKFLTHSPFQFFIPPDDRTSYLIELRLSPPIWEFSPSSIRGKLLPGVASVPGRVERIVWILSPLHPIAGAHLPGLRWVVCTPTAPIPGHDTSRYAGPQSCSLSLCLSIVRVAFSWSFFFLITLKKKKKRITLIFLHLFIHTLSFQTHRNT